MPEPTDEIFDLFIIGGGINGVGIAREAAGRGLRVALCEQGDLGQATSSASSKLIHGGIRYLEQYEFRLVRESLTEREVFLHLAPQLVRPMRFLMPHTPKLRPLWLIRLGLFLYDHLGKQNSLPASGRMDLYRDIPQCPLRAEYTQGFYYWDCVVDDSRLVIITAMDARRHGAEIYPRTRCIRADRGADDYWSVQLCAEDGHIFNHYARVLINATGPWANQVLDQVIGRKRTENFRLVQGSHLVVRQLYSGRDGYILQNPDRRIVFVIPFLDEFTLIGTTDVEHVGEPADVRITPKERDYLFTTVNRYFTKRIGEEDVIWSYSGVRPLYGDGSGTASEWSRDYHLELDAAEGVPLLTVCGGKITTHRAMAESVLHKLADRFGPAKGDWTAAQHLPGGDVPDSDLKSYLDQIRDRYPWMDELLLRRYVHAYGTLSESLLGDSSDVSDLGLHFGSGLYEREVVYLCKNEWARSSEDILWRRTKLGIKMRTEEVKMLSHWLEDHLTPSESIKQRIN